MKSRSIRTVLATASAAVLGAGILGISAPAAMAHDVVIGGNPSDGETVEEFPDTVTLEFSGQPKEGFNTLAISDVETEEVLYSSEPAVEGRDVILEMPDDLDPGAGEYRVGFQITSSDGHSTRGMTTFTVAGEGAQPAAQGSPAAAEDVEEDSAEEAGGLSGTLQIVLAAVGILALLAVVVLAIVKNRRINRSEE